MVERLPSKQHTRVRFPSPASGYNLWNPPPYDQWRAELDEAFKDIKIPKKLTKKQEAAINARIRRTLKDLEKDLEPYKPRPISMEMLLRPICDH